MAKIKLRPEECRVEHEHFAGQSFISAKFLRDRPAPFGSSLEQRERAETWAIWSTGKPRKLKNRQGVRQGWIADRKALAHQAGCRATGKSCTQSLIPFRIRKFLYVWAFAVSLANFEKFSSRKFCFNFLATCGFSSNLLRISAAQIGVSLVNV